MTKEEFKTKLAKLIEQFSNNEQYYKSKAYKEDELRQEFINPFFKALGWDMENEGNVAPQYRDVIHEDRIEIEGKPKAPDYSFKVGSERKFFVEAKAAFVKIVSEFPHSFQLRRYAWSGRLPVSLLTDFEEFSVYDSTIEPKQSDKVETARIKYIHYKDYLKEIDYLWDTFSKEAVWKGSFDKFAKASKRGTELVDKKFLNEIETWRSLLAKDIASNNENVDIYQLNEAVQKIIDRIIFLRIAEDRGIEFYETLKKTIESKDTYSKLIQVFKHAQDKYNSNLFDFEADKLTPSLKISDKVLDRIIGTLYYPKSPYEFSVIGVEILGSVYEQFLGKVIRLTKGHNAIIEEKPEVKKAGGVYYTPQYIVDYIVNNTVGELVKSKTPKEVSKLRIVDPACGSGSFLIGAYNFLLDWHLKYYIENNPEKYLKSKVLFKDSEGNYLLSTAEKKRILLNNIYGVDIDVQAVEVTKLSLALKMLENESRETINTQMKLFTDRILPDLGSNIKCGNSLIGSDYYNDKNLTLFNDEEIRKVNVFDWEKEFSEVFTQGGFDTVIGNPPWGASFNEAELIYLRNKYKNIIVRMIDSFMFFIDKGTQILGKKGYWGMIIPDVILYQLDNLKLREKLIDHFHIKQLLNLGDVFDNIVRPSAVIIFTNNEHRGDIKIGNFTNSPKALKSVEIINSRNYHQIGIDFIKNLPGKVMVTNAIDSYALLSKILKSTSTKLLDFVDSDGIQRGVSPDLKEAFIVDLKTIETFKLEQHFLQRVVTGGRNIKRYITLLEEKYLIYVDRQTNLKKIPRIKHYIDQFKDQITCKEVKTGKHTIYSLHRPRKRNIFEKPSKIMGVITEDEIIVTKDTTKLYASDGVYIFSVQNERLLNLLTAILNSKLFTFIYRLITFEKNRTLAQVKPSLLQTLPIKIPDKDLSMEIDSKANNMLEIKKQLHSERLSESQKKLLEQRVQTLDKQIDDLVYKLYGLSKKEINIIENK